MPVSYIIDHSRKLIRTTCTGIVRLADVLEHFETLRKDPFRPTDPDVLLNLTGLETPPGTPELQAVADRMGTGAPLIFRRCAIVVDRDLVFGLARMFVVFAEKHFQQTRVFRDSKEAMNWLEISRRPA